MPTSRNQCDNKRRQKCSDNFRTVYDTKYEEVCNDRPTQACEKHWQEDGKGGKVWADDPASCKTVYKTECKEEPKQYPRQEKYQTCNWETYQDCYQVAGPDDCQYVAKQRCYGRQSSVKGARCSEEPKQDCRVSFLEELHSKKFQPDRIRGSKDPNPAKRSRSFCHGSFQNGAWIWIEIGCLETLGSRSN